MVAEGMLLVSEDMGKNCVEDFCSCFNGAGKRAADFWFSYARAIAHGNFHDGQSGINVKINVNCLAITSLRKIIFVFTLITRYLLTRKFPVCANRFGSTLIISRSPRKIACSMVMQCLLQYAVKSEMLKKCRFGVSYHS